MTQLRNRPAAVVAFLAWAIALWAGAAGAQTDPLPSWNEGASKARIVAFVQAATTPGGGEYVPPPERVAVFDNDGTLWSEQPMYVQLAFAFDRVRALAPQHPEWKSTQPFQAVLEGDLGTLGALGEKGMVEIVMATHAGITTDEFATVVRNWAKTARHPTLNRPYGELTYRPMRELLDYLRANGFSTWIVTGGGIEFVRVFAEALYGVPPQQVIGSSVRTNYELRDGKPAIVRLPQVAFVDDGPGKPVGIERAIGRRPIVAFGNSDGDFQMLEWTTASGSPRLGAFIHHDDAAREVAYDRSSAVGRLDRGLDQAGARRWLVVSMKDDWKTIYPPAP